MNLRSAGLIVGVLALLVGGCSAAGATATPAATQAGANPGASPTGLGLPPAPAASPGPSSSAPAASSSPTALDPCAFLTNDQADAVNGGSYGDGVNHPLGPSAICVRLSTSPKASLTVSTSSGTDAIIAAKFGAFKASLKNYGVTDVAGIGDAAFIGRSTTPLTGGIYVRRGGTFFYVVYLGGTAPSDDSLKATANIVLGELP